MSNQQLKLLDKKLGVDFGNLRKKANVIGRGEAAQNSFGVEMRPM